MRTPDPKIKEALWKNVKTQLENPISMFVRNGVKPDKSKKQNAKDALIIALMAVTEAAYMSGLDRGYDMAATVFGGDE